MIVAFIVATAVLAVADLVAFIPFLAALVLRRIRRFHDKPVSDIPGNPHAFDGAIISSFRTLPEPSNTNIIVTALPLDQPLLMRCFLPYNARCSSLTLYGQKTYEVPQSIALEEPSGPDNSMEVVLFSSEEALNNFDWTKLPKPKENYLTLFGNNWKGGFCAMRNYLVPPGSRVKSPEIIKISDGSIFRRSSYIVTGPAHLELKASPRFRQWRRLIILNIVAAIVLKLVLGFSINYTWSCVSAAALSFYLIYRSFFRRGKQSLKKFVSELVNERDNVLVPTDLDQGSSVSQPSTLHKYWVMRFNLDGNQDIEIKGKLRSNDMKYWSFIAYDDYGMPLSQYFYDVNSRNFQPEDLEQFHYCIRMSARHDACSGENFDMLCTEGVRTGYVLFRIVHPRVSESTVFENPDVKVLVGTSKKTD